MSEKGFRNTTAVLAMFVLALLLAACYPTTASVSTFPTGKFKLQNSENRALQFNKDGTFAALDGDTQLAKGTYSANAGVYTVTSNDQDCIVPRHYNFTFDGTKLVFHPVEDPAADTCGGRRLDFNETVTWLMAK
jgi:hypothetical protein